ncbi:hypothetical protein J5Y04_18990 [Kitasatospora sp. RG8]|uniref:DUF11 domain-containing protein n=1 Tax=Kitasatospora sp. RG8 TaxID=2820815 RepID=UPI001AE0CF27|nr:DUF11 domain-containing protein [Kitasatospora sp. RG8]MBP0451616.1 hypothetical protein [Kitasatospora sp. RG8]
MTTRLSVLRLTAVVAAVVMAVLVGFSGCSSSDSGKGGNGPRATSSPPADETAANGPLVGTPSLVAGEQSCAAAEGNAPWFPTIAAFEVHDSNRTHLYACAHFLGAQPNNQVFAHSSDQVYVTPYNIVDRGPNELYVYGGGYGDDPAASGSFVSRVEPGTFNEVWRRVLINTNATDEWNYPGVLNTLADGSLVVIYGYHIARIDPANGNVLAQTTLPTGQSAPRDTAYNGYDALPDGTIVAKTVNRQPGCTEQGFSAFLDCPDPTAVPPSILVAIDPRSLQVLSQVTLPEMMGGRITTTVFNGTGQIYLPGATKLYRYSYPNGAFAPDPTWGPVPYLQSGQTAASAMAVINDYVVAMTNGGKPTPTPMSVVAVSQADSTKVATVQPFANSGAKQSFIPSMVSVDPENNRVYAMDAGAGKLAGIDLAGATAVSFGAAGNATAFSCTATGCTATAPAASAAGAVDVRVTTPGGTSATSPADRFTYAAPTADLAVSLGATPVGGLLFGRVDYTLTLTNQGPGRVDSATVSADLPGGFTASSTDCTVAAGKLTCTLATPLAAGATTTRHLSLQVGLLNLGRTFTVTAARTASAPVDPVPANDRASRTCSATLALLISCS